MNTVSIKSGEKNYDVTVLNQVTLQKELEEIAKDYRKLVILIDANVKALYPEIVDYEKYDYLVLNATEEQKSFHNLDYVFDFYQRIGMQKKDVVIAIGGGIIQDIVSLTTKIYWRGIDHFLVPTTLLSMADSSIGAKCGINYRDKKNQIAVFHSPSGVIQNLNFLNTLKDEDIVSGVGEIVKLLITSNEEDFSFLEKNIQSALSDRSKFSEIIIRSLLSKKSVIEEDEYESDLRRVLNYGHTLGHAVESLSNYSISHGVAVLWGMDIMNHIACQRGYMSEALYTRINKLILSTYDITKIKVDNYDKLLDLVKSDKKVSGSKINIVFPEAIGRLVIRPVEMDDIFLQNIKNYYSR